MAIRGPQSRLFGRLAECRELDDLVSKVRAEQSRVLVIHGQAGMGKTALLDYLVSSASDFLVTRAAGVESEMELPFAGIHQLSSPLLGLLPQLPEPQRDALQVAFGLVAGRPPDRFLVGLAVLSLLSEASSKQPLLCLIDDAQWLDQASVQIMALVARRVLVDRIALVFATRDLSPEFSDLPLLAIGGLDASDARRLLESVPGAPIDERVRDRIVGETRGNPLALREWHHAMTPTELAGGWSPASSLPLVGQIEAGFGRRLAQLPADTRRFLVVAAAEPVGDPVTVRKAVEVLGVDTDAVSPAVEAGLIEIGTSVLFRHPLVRSAAYRTASLADRRNAHRSLAAATDPDIDPDRRAWHLAQAASGPDEEVASELERSAERARQRGGSAAAGGFLERSVALTVDPVRRVGRTIAAAQAKQAAGEIESAIRLLASLEEKSLDERTRASVALLRGQMAFLAGKGQDAPRLLVEAAKQAESFDPGLARAIFLQAMAAASQGGGLSPEPRLRAVAEAVRSASRPTELLRPFDLLLDGLALFDTDGPQAAAPTLHEAVSAYNRPGVPPEDLYWLSVAIAAASILWDHDSWEDLASQDLQRARQAGALTSLSYALNGLASVLLFKGNLDIASSLLAEAEALTEAINSQYSPFASMHLSALKGREQEATAHIESGIKSAHARGQGLVVAYAHSMAATLYNGLGRYDKALAAAQQADRQPRHWGSHLTLHELIESAVRCGRRDLADEAFERQSATTSAGGTAWAQGVEARSRAMLSEGAGADALYREAIVRLEATGLITELARTHLLYGEWLRRERRRLEAREQLRSAHRMFTAMGAEGFAERARIELNATGETARRRVVESSVDLTAQEIQVCRLVAEGGTNAEVAARLFISPRTVDYHLRKVFRKLGVKSRTELVMQLAGSPAGSDGGISS